MITALVHLATGEFIEDVDGKEGVAGYERVELPRNPDATRERYSGNLADPFRTATDDEIELRRRRWYRVHREAAYPSWAEVNEAVIESLEGRPDKLTEVSAKRAVVREAYPKPSS